MTVLKIFKRSQILKVFFFFDILDSWFARICRRGRMFYADIFWLLHLEKTKTVVCLGVKPQPQTSEYVNPTCLRILYGCPGASLGTQMVKNPPAVKETWVQSLGWEDLLEKGMGYPLQCFCLENSMNSGAWQAISGV